MPIFWFWSMIIHISKQYITLVNFYLPGCDFTRYYSLAFKWRFRSLEFTITIRLRYRWIKVYLFGYSSFGRHLDPICSRWSASLIALLLHFSHSSSFTIEHLHVHWLPITDRIQLNSISVAPRYLYDLMKRHISYLWPYMYLRAFGRSIAINIGLRYQKEGKELTVSGERWVLKPDSLDA